MKERTHRIGAIIFALWLILTCLLLIVGYRAEVPEITTHEFPISLSYEFEGEVHQVSEIFVGEHVRRAQYWGESDAGWMGYIKGQDILLGDTIPVVVSEERCLYIELNIPAGWLMGDPKYAHLEPMPQGVGDYLDGEELIPIETPEDLESIGFQILDWEYPQPIENSFRFGGFALSSETVIFTSGLALLALILCLFLVKRASGVLRSKLDIASIVLNILIAAVVFPFFFFIATLSEILESTGFFQQLLYLTPAFTLICVAGSVALRRWGKHLAGFGIQFGGIVLFGLLMLTDLGIL